MGLLSYRATPEAFCSSDPQMHNRQQASEGGSYLALGAKDSPQGIGVIYPLAVGFGPGNPSVCDPVSARAHHSLCC